MRPLSRGIVRGAAASIAAAAVILMSACAPQSAEPNDPLGTTPNQIRLYGSDGNMANSVAALLKAYPAGLAGMKGTAPLTPLSASFTNRLRSIDKALMDFIYAGESYDAVVISALAAETAKSTNPAAIAAQITGVTTGGTACETAADCFAAVRAGKDIAYRGISLRLGGLTDAGEPSASTYGILRFAGNNVIDMDQTEYVQAGDPGGSSTKKPPAGVPDGSSAALKIGTLLPHTGQLASSGPPMFAGVRLAINDVNALGGVLGRQVIYADGDDGTDPAVAKATAQRLIGEGVQVIIGAGASGITKAVLPITVAAGVVLFSPCNTAAELTTADDKGLYFRTAPADGLQAAALKNIIMRDGVRKLVIVARDDAYGQGLMKSVKEDLVLGGLADADVRTITYSVEGTPDFSSLGEDVKAFGPDGVLVIGFDESMDAFAALLKAGFSSRVI